ncbi:hypothetical protein [Geomonas edaphica]|uniref:hypothetical protein n=1 Tax=Geomonas edaphica TaxID=2570226 RepID=UPI0010A90281|nr:hypothetical protein [Geomonas edaphica]
MTKSEIITAIERARPGISRYLEIMERFPQTDVSQDRDFQRLFNGFYRVNKKQQSWYDAYYSYMESQKGKQPTFGVALRHLHSELNRCEASFTSKLVATINPDCPVWDQYVLANAGIRRPPYYSRTKVADSIDCYHELQCWYERFVPSEQGQLMITVFQDMVPLHEKITDLKKIDFILWQSREL